MKTLIKSALTIFTIFVLNVSVNATNVTGTSGSFSISSYTDNQTLVWDINTTVNYKPVKITFNLSSEKGYDFLKIYAIDIEGKETLIDYSSGTNVCRTINTYLPTGKARVVFTSDGSVNTSNNSLYWGFTATYEVDNSLITTGDLKVNGNISGNQSQGALRIQTSYGTLDLGSMDANWAHIYTDRSKLITNKPLYTINGEFSSYYNTDMKLQTYGTTRLTILNNNGFVGIGTNTPDHLLTVKGTIHAKEILVDYTGPLADYVFEPDYHLKSLREVETFIQKNKHLPEIPSAKEVKENGLSVAEMQNKLLQKIEELTLYVIEQQKEIDQLKGILDQQNK